MGRAETILIVGLGEAGSYLAHALKAADGAPRLIGYDAALSSPDAPAGLRAKASDLGIKLHENLGPWAGEADIAFSLVPGSVAPEAARSLRPLMKAGAVFADLNSITAEMMRGIAALFDGTDIDVVDGSVLGNFRAGGRVPVLLAGERREDIRGLLAGEMFNPECIDGSPGDASAVKMLRSVLMKGLEALFVESLVAAEAQGLRATFMRAFRDLDERPFAETMEVQTVTHLVHAARRLGEIERVQSLLRADGVDDTMTEASRRLYAKTVAAGVAPASGEPLSLDDTLRVLMGIFRDPPQ